MERDQYELLYQCEERLWWFAGMRRIAEALFRPRIRPGLRLIEAGCGTGFNTLFFERQYNWKVFAFDYSEHALRFARERGLERLAQASVTELPYPTGAFDCATCLEVLALLDEPQAADALAGLHPVLQPGGFLLVRD